MNSTLLRAAIGFGVVFGLLCGAFIAKDLLAGMSIKRLSPADLHPVVTRQRIKDQDRTFLVVTGDLPASASVVLTFVAHNSEPYIYSSRFATGKMLHAGARIDITPPNTLPAGVHDIYMTAVINYSGRRQVLEYQPLLEIGEGK